MKKNNTPRVTRLNLLSIWGIPILIICSYGFLALQPDLRQSVPALVGVTGLVTIMLTVGLYTGEKRGVNWSPWAVLVVATIIRLLFLFRSPELSDDLYRYLWDGLQVLMGNSPYSLAPGSVQPHDAYLAHLARQINHPDLITIYPPAAQLVFAFGALLGGGVLGLKIVMVSVDIATCFLLIKLCTRLRLPPWRALLYAWHPLPVLEIAGSGHIDGAGLFLFLLTFFLLGGRSSPGLSERHGHGWLSLLNTRKVKTLGAGLAFAGAALMKLVPLMFLPGCLMATSGQTRSRFLAGFAAGAAFLVIPFLPEIRNGLGTLAVFARHFEFSGFVYRTLRAYQVSPDNARLLLHGVFVLVACAVYGTLWLRQKGSACRMEANERFQTWGLTPAPGRCGDAPLLAELRAFYVLSMAFLLLTPVLNPWYALTFAVFLPFAAEPAGLVLSWSVFLSYQVLIPATLLGQWTEESLTPALIWLAPCAAFLLSIAAQVLLKGEAFRARRSRR